MKTIKQILSESPEECVSMMHRDLTHTTNSKKRLAVRVVRLEQEKPADENLAKFIKRKLGIEIQRVIQHVYELAHIVRAVQSGKVNVSEEQFWKLTTYNLVQLSAFITKEQYKAHLSEATDAVISGKKVRQKLAALRKAAKGEKPPKKTGKQPTLFNVEIVKAIRDDIDNGDAELLTAYAEILGKMTARIEKRFDLTGKSTQLAESA